MPGGLSETIRRWFLLVWASSLLFAVLLIVPSLLFARSIVTDVREAMSRQEYSAAATTAARLTLPANTCRIALLLPGPWSLHFVPGIAYWYDAAETACSIAYDVGAAAQLPSVRTVATTLNGGTLQGLRVERAFVQQVTTAVDDAKPLLTSALDGVQHLDELDLPVAGDSIRTIAQAWPPSRIREAQTLLGVSSEFLGFDRPRTYFVALQSNAEMRATGGFIGQYAIVRIADGKPKVLDVGINSTLQTPAKPGVRLLPGTEAITFTDNPMWVNSNLSPHGPDVGALWMYAWKQQTGQQLDGAIGLDVATAADLVASAGGFITRPDGTQLKAANDIADYSQNGVYLDFTGVRAGIARKAYQEQVLRDLLRDASSSLMSFRSLLDVLPAAIAERRVLITFAEPGLQSRIAGSPVAQDLRAETDTAQVTWNNWAGNKFDFYMRATASATCTSGGADLRLDVVSTAVAGKQYPTYIAQRLDDPGEKRASVRDQFLVVLPPGANVRWLTVDGRIAAFQVSDLGKRPVVQTIIDTVAGQRHDVRIGIGGTAVRAVQVQGSPAVPVRCG